MSPHSDSPEDMQYRVRTPIEMLHHQVAERTLARLSRVRGDMSDIAFDDAVRAVTAMHLKELEREGR